MHYTDRQQYTWDDVREDMGDWPSDLQTHARRNLEDQPVHEVPADQIDMALVRAAEKLGMLPVDPEFDAFCADSGIDAARDVGRRNHATALAAFCEERARDMRHDGKALDADSLEVLSFAPAFLHEQRHLDQERGHHEQHDSGSLHVLSFFNSRIRAYAEAYPDVSATSLEAALAAVGTSFKVPMNAEEIAGEVHGVVMGARHEVVFGQLLAATHHEFREANLDEDLHGIDYVVDEHSRNPLFIDVKASLKELHKHGVWGKEFMHRRDHKVVMHSMVQTEHLRDKFFLLPRAVAAKAQQINTMIQQAESENQHYYAH